MGIRCRKNGHVLELWLGIPDHPESDLIACFDEAYLPEVQKQLNEIRKWPKTPVYSGRHYPIKRIKK
jgi:hypothetical protein